MSKHAKPKSRLGRGLSSLMGVGEEHDGPMPVAGASEAPIPTGPSPAVDAGPRVLEIPVHSILPNPHQPRRDFHEASLQELAASLRSTGLIQPILVRPRPDDGGYELIAGERRLRAAKLVELETIPAIVRDVDRYTQAQMALVENIQREDLNPIDRALAYRMLIDELGLTQNELAGRLGEDRSSVANYLRLLDLAEPVRDMVSDGRLSMGHAKLLASVPDPDDQKRLANLVLLQNLSVRNLERKLEERTAKPAEQPPAPAGSTNHIKDLEKNISRQLGLRVAVKESRKKGKGRLVIQYGNFDQFDELMSRLGVKLEE